MEAVDFLFLGSKITADGDCSHILFHLPKLFYFILPFKALLEKSCQLLQNDWPAIGSVLKNSDQRLRMVSEKHTKSHWKLSFQDIHF